jgi:hypothetical protein
MPQHRQLGAQNARASVPLIGWENKCTVIFARASRPGRFRSRCLADVEQSRWRRVFEHACSMLIRFKLGQGHPHPSQQDRFGGWLHPARLRNTIPLILSGLCGSLICGLVNDGLESIVLENGHETAPHPVPIHHVLITLSQVTVNVFCSCAQPTDRLTFAHAVVQATVPDGLFPAGPNMRHVAVPQIVEASCPCETGQVARQQLGPSQ